MAANIIHANSKYARDIGFDYGIADNTVQAELFNGLADGLATSCGGSANIEAQLYYLVGGLDLTARKMIEELAGHIAASES